MAAALAVDAEVRLYATLFASADAGDVQAGADWKANLNPDSIETLSGCKLEPSLAGAVLDDRFQFERVGYFCVDPDSAPGALVFNRTVTLKDAWVKIEKKQA